MRAPPWVAGIDLLGPFKAGLREIAAWIVDAMTGVIGLLLDLYVGLLGRFLYLDVSRLATLEGMWTASAAVYVGGLGLVGLGALGTIQLFPGATKLDPYRLGERALLATVGLVLVNPPGTANGLFGKGAMAWAFALTNAFQGLYLQHVARSAIVLDLGSVGEAAGTVFASVVATGVLAVLLGLSVLPAVLVLGVRQFVLFGVYALFPLLALLWVVDAGPLQYGHLIAATAFRAAAILLVLGVIVSGTLAASVGIIGATHGTSPGGTSTDGPTATVLDHDDPTPVRAGALASDRAGARTAITTVIDVVGSALLVSSVTLVATISIVGTAMDGG